MTRNFTDRADLMNALRPLDPQGRAEILYHGDNRSLVLSSGANVTLFARDEGEIRRGRTLVEQLGGVRLALIQRMRGPIPDGFGALGGLSERTPMTSDTFNALAAPEQKALADLKDDVFPGSAPDEPHRLTTNIDEIRVATVLREMAEELHDANLGPIADRLCDPASGLGETMNLMPLEGVFDDNFILNIWARTGGDDKPAEEVFAISPYCHTLEIGDDLFGPLTGGREEVKEGGEVRAVQAVPLIDALMKWGKTGGAHTAKEDNRDMEFDYRYPHEWMASWFIASQQLEGLGHDRESGLVELAAEVQKEIYERGLTHKIDFGAAAAKMKIPLENMDAALMAPPGTVAKMQEAIDAVYVPHGISPAQPKAALSARAPG